MAEDPITFQPPELPAWDDRDRAASLRNYRAYVEAEALRSLAWYWHSKRTVRLLASGLQYSRVVLMALAAILPIVGQLSGSAVLSNALLACLLVGGAAALQACDKQLGISSAWVRYVLAATAIRKALEDFRMDWVLLQAKAETDAAEFLELARKFHATVAGLVSQDTQAWAIEQSSSYINDKAA
jgi:hypothetical protein